MSPSNQSINHAILEPMGVWMFDWLIDCFMNMRLSSSLADNAQIVSGSSDKTVMLWDVTTGQAQRKYRRPRGTCQLCLLQRRVHIGLIRQPRLHRQNMGYKKAERTTPCKRWTRERMPSCRWSSRITKFWPVPWTGESGGTIYGWENSSRTISVLLWLIVWLTERFV